MDHFMIAGLIGAVFASLITFIVLDLIVKIFVKDKKRPSEIISLVVIFMLGFLSYIYKLLFLRTTMFDPLTFIMSILGILWLIGIWKMKKWGAAGYCITIALVQLISVFQNRLSIFSILFF